MQRNSIRPQTGQRLWSIPKAPLRGAMTVPLRGAMTEPPFHPNCRSVTAPYFDDEFELGTRAARDPETGKTVSVPEDMTYPEWKKVFVDKTETVAEWKKQKHAPVEAPKEFLFKPAESIEAAEEYAKKFISDGYSPTFKNQAVYKGISLEHANEINKTLEELYSEYDLPPISGIKVISPTSAQGKKVFKDGADAVAAYNPTEKGLFINKDVLKNAKALEKYNTEAKEAYNYVVDNIDSLKGSQRTLAETYQKAGRSLVGDGSIKDYITHEMGHHVQWDVLSTDVNNAMGKSLSEYAPQISGYANASKGEYIAESFVAYTKGERNILDPQFVEFLDKNVAKGVVKSAESDIIKANERFKRTAGELPKEYVDALNTKFSQGNEIAKRVYDKYVPNGGVVADTNSGDYYHSKGKVYLNVSSDVINKRGAGTTWFHEHGHYIDYMCGRVSKSEDFRNAIIADVRAYEKQVKKEKGFLFVSQARIAIGSELKEIGDISASIQDIFGGVIKKPYPNCDWMHKSDYWKNSEWKLSLETFAHMFEASFDNGKAELMKKYLPTAWGEFEGIMKLI